MIRAFRRPSPLRRPPPGVAILVLVLFGFASALVGLAHRPVPTPAVDIGPSAYVLPDGSIPVICGPSGAGDRGATRPSPCGACLLAAAPGLPPADAMPLLSDRPRQTEPGRPFDLTTSGSASGRPRCRAPPFTA